MKYCGQPQEGLNKSIKYLMVGLPLKSAKYISAGAFVLVVSGFFHLVLSLGLSQEPATLTVMESSTRHKLPSCRGELSLVYFLVKVRLC